MDLGSKLRQLATAAEKTTREAVTKAGHLTHEKRDSINAGLDKVTSTIEGKTDGKYSEKVAKARRQIDKGINKVAEQRPQDPRDGGSGETGAPGTPGGSATTDH